MFLLLAVKCFKSYVDNLITLWNISTNLGNDMVLLNYEIKLFMSRQKETL